MKRLTCEMCGSTDMLKEDGAFVCQSCGCKYSVEEARKLMIEGTIEVQGRVKIDSSDEIKNLYQAARNARGTSDAETAVKHYERITVLDPNSWEAAFYCVVLKFDSVKNGQIGSAAIKISNCLSTVLYLIKNYVKDEKEQKKAIKEVSEECFSYAEWLVRASDNFFDSLTEGNGLLALTGVRGAISSYNSYSEHLDEHKERCEKIVSIMYNCGTSIEKTFNMNDEDIRSYVFYCYKKGIELNNLFNEAYGITLLSGKTVEIEKKLATLRGKNEKPQVHTLTIKRQSAFVGCGLKVKIKINNRELAIGSGDVIKEKLEYGNYSISLSCMGYKSCNVRVLMERDVTLNISLSTFSGIKVEII